VFQRAKPLQFQVERFLAAAASKPLAYSEIGIACRATAPGYQIDAARALLGRGDAVFERAAAALRNWAMFDPGWITATASAEPIEPGVNVAVVARHLGFWSLNACRIVYMIEPESAQQRFGFAYGTLTDHAAQGEELFEVSLDLQTAEVFYRVRAASRPQAFLAKLGYPYARLLQARFRKQSCLRMQVAAGGDEVILAT